MNLNVYREVKTWKKPLHFTRTKLAKTYLKLIPKIQIIAIAGSVGKTLTQNSISSVLSQKYPTIVGEENLDPTFRIPQTILNAKPWHKYLILEYGVEHPHDMDHYLKIAKPKIGVMTVLSPEHTKYFGNMEGVIKEESKLVHALPKSGYAILNADDPLGDVLASKTSATIVWYGQKAKKGIKISHFKQNMHGSNFRIHYGGQLASVHWKIVGKHQLLSVYAASTVGIICGLTIKQIAKGLSQVKVPIHRLSAKTTDHINILDDTYNSSPSAAIESIATLVELGKGKKKIAVLGEMKDLGELSEASHQEIGEKLAKSRINYLITLGNVAGIISKSAKKAGFRGKIINVKSTKKAIQKIKQIASKKTLVLIKGSRHAHMERIVYGLLHKSTEINCYHCGKLK